MLMIVNGGNDNRTPRPDAADDKRTVRMSLPPEVEAEFRKRYGEPGQGMPSARPDTSAPGLFRTIGKRIREVIGRFVRPSS